MSTSLSDDVDATFGILFIGFMFSSAFYGCTFFQSYVFFTRYPSENPYTKYIIGLLCSVDTVVTGLISHTMYEYLINNFTVSFDRLNVLRTFITSFALTSTEVLIIQLFYVFRTWSLGERRPLLPGIMSLISVMSFALAIATAVQMSKQSLFVDIVSSRVELLAGLSEGLAALCNVIIVTTQYYYLRPSRQPGMKVSQGWFDIGILHTLSRGTLFTILQLVLLVTFVSIPQQYVWVCFHFIIGKVYANSLLAMLNSRNPYRGRGLNEEESLNTRSRTTGSGSGSSRVHRMSLPTPVSPLDIDAKGGPSMAVELGVIPSRSEVGGGDESLSKSVEVLIESAELTKR